jgi:hypothetical protein
VKLRNRSVTVTSPYTHKSVDAAIIHLERVLSSDGADSLFARGYWRGRVLQAYATPGLLSEQKERLQRLLARIGEFEPEQS